MEGKDKEQLPVEVTDDIKLKLTLEIEKKKWDILEKYVLDELKVGVDWGYIAKRHKDTGKIITDDEGKIVTVGDKPSLFKGGAERILTRMHCTATIKRDSDTWEMLGSPKGVICYIAEIWDDKKEKTGEGRGCANLQERTIHSENTCAKIAKKRAIVDGVIQSFGLSSKFTQDIEDMDIDLVNGKMSYSKKGVVDNNENDNKTPTIEQEEKKESKSLKEKIKEKMTEEFIAYAKKNKWTSEQMEDEIKKIDRIGSAYGKGLKGRLRLTTEVIHWIRVIERRSDKYGEKDLIADEKYYYNWAKVKKDKLQNKDWQALDSHFKAINLIAWMEDNKTYLNQHAKDIKESMKKIKQNLTKEV